MARLSLIVEAALALWFAGLFGLIVVQLWRGRIVSAGLLAIPNGPPVAASRFQLVLVTAAVAGGYAVVALTGPAGAGLPDPPAEVLLALLGSHGVYHGRKQGWGRARA